MIQYFFICRSIFGPLRQPRSVGSEAPPTRTTSEQIIVRRPQEEGTTVLLERLPGSANFRGFTWPMRQRPLYSIVDEARNSADLFFPACVVSSRASSLSVPRCATLSACSSCFPRLESLRPTIGQEEQWIGGHIGRSLSSSRFL